MTDYEQALMNTLEIQYPLAEISGCWFHYVNAVVKCKHFGLFGLLKLQVHSDLKKWVRLLLCLSLLPPNHIQPTLGNLNPNLFVVSLSINDFAKCQSLMTYMETFWIGRIGGNKISVFGCPRRTNSDQESFHASLLKRIKIAHPNIWVFITELRKFAEVQQLDKIRLECGLQIRRRRKQKYVLKDRKIRVATENLANGRLTSLEFLQSVSHCADALFNNQLGVSRINQPPESETVSSFTQVQIEPSQPNLIPPQDEAQQLNVSIPRDVAIVQNTDDVAIVQNTFQLGESLHSSTEIVGVTETSRVVDETNGTTCPVCLENTPNFAAVPCGHMVCTMCIPH
ncbi:uncharacterized protein LOC136091950 [Hydra vulgaris]|uniref:Uncharacterized protein LOC136091950 n=1 Tax=Hydra vulgaris TaxID=6087 RepID=A0ABM4DMG3_HYDVU